ncbi:MAG: biosynthetic arginine decarboxylase [Proteobacteria bacterium]|nr:biosynthetic arginine decarboxylase [Pseudomonadota bacterium]
MNKRAIETWSAAKSADLYGVKNWSGGYFDVADNGDMCIKPSPTSKTRVSIPDIIAGIRDRGLDLPVLLRIENILDSQISLIHKSFRSAIKSLGYKGEFRGVYPIKVNQQEQVIGEICAFGSRFHHGLEVGSKAELITALSHLTDHKACLICNGYKDAEFIDLALYARKMGFNCFLVLEMPSELDLVLERAEALGIDPQIGIRIKVSSQVGGHWAESAGDLSIFGLSASEVVDALDRLKEVNKLDCVRLLHFHLGSQVPNIRDIRAAVHEVCRMYAELASEGCPMGYLDLGGGLAVDYDGSHTNFESSRNYSLEEYCADVVESVMTALDERDIPHPHIITESGRATVAYYSVLLFDVMDVSRLENRVLPPSVPEDYPDPVHNLLEVHEAISPRKLQECYNDAIFYRDEMRQQFNLGQCTLRQRAMGETIFWAIMRAVSDAMEDLKVPPRGLTDISYPLASIYYCNMSVFQSLPDAWAIDQLFPIMPLHRLNEQPLEKALLADITCDCDGKIDHFIDPRQVKRVLELHPFVPGERYYLGAFLVGAYQETLGDLHNLFGDTNVVSIRLGEEGGFDIVRELEGDSVADVLSYVEYDPKTVAGNFRNTAEQAVRDGKLTPQERRDVMRAFRNCLEGYTYLHSR